MKARVGIDIGGTFTDLVLATEGGKLHFSKVSSTPDDPSTAVVEGLASLLRQIDLSPSTIVEIVHGTTVGSNTILERSGARTALLTTRGFRDVLEIGRIRTPAMFDLTWEKPKPLIERHNRYEVDERVAADGSVVETIDVDQVVALGRTLLAEDIEAVAICFINSYANPAHEKLASDALRSAYPQLRVTASHEVLPEMKEYERTSTTAVNAYLLPRMQTYLERLSDRLHRMDVRAPLQVMASSGGIIGAEVARRLPVFAVASGPAGGVTGSAVVARDFPPGGFVVFDMGGTTAKASILEDGRPALVTEYEFRDGISTPSRFVKGGGYMLKVPSIDIAEVGAGGGSLAFVDDGGLLHVGPKSAGADPGPACYARGNDRPTVTDANMCLGYLNPEYLAGGSLLVRRDLAEKAIDASIAKNIGLSTIDAAHGIRQVANANMARAIRAVTVERGKDPRDMTMIAFGGNGPLHAVDVARLLGIKRVVAPVLSGVFAAAGMLSADVEHNFVRASPRRLGEVKPEWIADQLSELEQAGRAALAAEGYGPDSSRFSFFADLRYEGQSSEITVPMPASSPGLFEELVARFQAEHLALFGYSTEEAVELANLRLTAVGLSDHRLRFGNVRIEEASSPTTTPTRRVSLHRGAALRDVPLVQRSSVGPDVATGPAIIESYDTTIFVPDGCHYHADAIGNVIIDINA